jgi:hypothetical protein
MDRIQGYWMGLTWMISSSIFYNAIDQNKRREKRLRHFVVLMHTATTFEPKIDSPNDE